MKKMYLYPLPIRIWHWVNGFIIVMLTLTGLQLRIPEIAVFSRYETAVFWHKYIGFSLGASFAFWLGYCLATGSLKRHYFPRLPDIKGMPRQAFFYAFSIFQGKTNPFMPSEEGKFNPLQKISYLSIMTIFTPFIFVTGVLFSDIFYFLPWINAIGGLRMLDALHVICGYGFVLYLIVHCYMATIGRPPWAHIKAMLSGYEEEAHEAG